jgi:hypothetical protein
MGKPEALVVGPAMVRPPRPAARDRSMAGTPEPPLATSLDSEVVVIHPSPDEIATAAEAHDEQPAPAGGAAVPRRTGSLLRAHSPDAVTVPLAVLSAVPTPQAVPRVLDLPMAALEKPSATLEPTPSPVPRASLIPATRDGAAVPADAGVLNSRNVPTVAARSVAVERPLRRQPAAAVTFPPGRAQPREGRMARRLAADVRSSKREIVLGLAIGMSLAAALGVIGQRYLARRAPAGTSVMTNATQPRPEENAPLREDWSLRPQPAHRQALPADAPKSAAETQAPALEPAMEDEAERPRRARAKPARGKAAASRPPAAASPPDLFSEEPRGSSEDAWIEGPKPPAKAPPSPAESAGLGMDLSL